MMKIWLERSRKLVNLTLENTQFNTKTIPDITDNLGVKDNSYFSFETDKSSVWETLGLVTKMEDRVFEITKCCSLSVSKTVDDMLESKLIVITPDLSGQFVYLTKGKI